MTTQTTPLILLFIDGGLEFRLDAGTEELQSTGSGAELCGAAQSFGAAMSGTLVVIPARLAASRLPRKPLADICGSPMIIHVLQRAREADVGPVVVATDSVEIADVVASSGGQAVMTSERHQSGSDRIYEAVNLYDAAGQADVIVNLQGDLPTVEPEVVRAAARLLSDPAVDIGTVAAQIRREEEHFESAVVKAVGYLVTPNRLRALYFTRATAPWGEGPRYHHIGLYAYRRSALQRFVALGPSSLEQREKLEQLRALENNMRIDVAIVDGVPLGVDTPSDLERARELLSGQKRDAPHGT